MTATDARTDDRWGTTLPPGIRRRLRLQAAVSGTPMSKVLAVLLDEALPTEAELAAQIVSGGRRDDPAV